MCRSISLLITLAILAIIGQTEVNARAALKIVNGTDAAEGEFPYTVQLVAKAGAFFPVFACGGSIISPEWVLTTGSCLREVDIGFIAYGSLKVYPDESSAVNFVKQSIVHPRYSVYEGISYYDIGLVQLREPLEFTDKLHAVKLPDTEDVPFHVTGTVSGWGMVGPREGLPSTNLQKLSIQLLNDQECGEKISGFVPAYHVCADDNQKGQCDGDSGNPFVINGTQYGVSSWARGCGVGPGVYSRISNPEFRKWITKVTGI